MLSKSHAFSERVQEVVDEIGEAVVACDLNGKITFYNSAATRLLGPDVSRVPEKWASDFGAFSADRVTPFPLEEQPLLLGLKGKGTDGVEQFIRNTAKPFGLFVSISGRPVFDEKSQILGCVVVIRDISPQKRAEEDLKKSNTSLAEKNLKLQAINQELEAFSYAVSHDLRTPLRSIIGFSDILLKKFADNLVPEGLDYLIRIKDSGDRLGQLIDGLLVLSRLTRGDIRRDVINLSSIALSVIRDLKSEQPDRKVEFLLPDSVPVVADERLLRSVLQNLLSNAWKFTGKTSLAKIELGVSTSEVQRTVYFIKDNGVGFNEKYSDKLFNIFQSLHSRKDFDGNGIGLATVHRIIKRHGGSIWAKSKPNEGATFFFTL